MGQNFVSRELIDRSPDLSRLDRDGFVLEIRAGHLVVHDVPYVGADRSVKRGSLAAKLNLDGGDQISSPLDHTILFVGEYPCDSMGNELEQLRCNDRREELGNGIVTRYMFSRKPAAGRYRDYHHMIQQYVHEIQRHAQEIDSTVTAKTRTVVENPGTDDDVFHYGDVASSCTGTTTMARRLADDVVAIVGLGGTGSYVLDLVAKTWVKEIHLFDHDRFQQKNAFRAPGAPSVATLRQRPTKVEYFKQIYDNMRKGIVVHDCRIDTSNVIELTRMTFVFICIDETADKKTIVQVLEKANIDYIDVGLGVSRTDDDKLQGLVRTTTSTDEMRSEARSRIRGRQQRRHDEYDQPDVQLAELNSLNACLAVIRWKKIRGFYGVQGREFNSVYSVDNNKIVNDCIANND